MAIFARVTASAALGLYLLAAGACAPAATSERIYVAPTNETVRSHMVARYDGRGQDVMVRNMSSVEIVVTSLNITVCENVTPGCGVRRLQVRVRAGAEERIATIRTQNTGRGSEFQYTWTWEPVGGPPAIPAATPPEPEAAPASQSTGSRR